MVLIFKAEPDLLSPAHSSHPDSGCHQPHDAASAPRPPAPGPCLFLPVTREELSNTGQHLLRILYSLPCQGSGENESPGLAAVTRGLLSCPGRTEKITLSEGSLRCGQRSQAGKPPHRCSSSSRLICHPLSSDRCPGHQAFRLSCLVLTVPSTQNVFPPGTFLASFRSFLFQSHLLARPG